MSRRVVLGVCGGIAAYKAVEVCRLLVESGMHVAPVLTEGATHFVGPLTFSALASEPARTTLLGAPEPVPHTTLGQSADLVIVAPATAKLLGKYAAGISDDLLTATLLATRAPVLLAPAMHTEMWEHPAVRANVETLLARGVHLVGPDAGPLAGGDVGVGRLADPARIVDAALGLVGGGSGPLTGRRVLVTSGGTREAIDPVRYIGNRSSGKMGDAVAAAAARRGAEVVLVTTTSRPTREGIEVVRVESAQEMADVVLDRFDRSDAVVMAAAVADFRPKTAAPTKIKKGGGVPEILLEPTPDILAMLGERKAAGQMLVGFAAETGNLRANAAAKLTAKRLDLIVANDVTEPGSGFEVDTNRATLLDSAGGVDELPLMSKAALAEVVVDRIEGGLAARDGGGAGP
ncbi:MAG: bifunctional phosphopantothenoylcysteine decarboxylase/phosphopantothenate--cysteine ligase CoaBC [Acidimicrobiia bacterium]|nr:bifunctional phosphopantothenoylcysteine decarboxylase/phosphopantothenate--cysteine ligase CoaBC [Acidimicrobiia bacterium]